jgi:hypothetical protein
VLTNFDELLARRQATIFYSKFLADHPVDRAPPSAAKEDRPRETEHAKQRAANKCAMR